jgi:hypothetical protein
MYLPAIAGLVTREGERVVTIPKETIKDTSIDSQMERLADPWTGIGPDLLLCLAYLEEMDSFIRDGMLLQVKDALSSKKRY